MRICHARGNVEEANRLLQELKESRDAKNVKGVTLRLRTYLPVLNLYVDSNNCEGAFEVYRDIVQDELVVGEREYILLLKVATAAQVVVFFFIFFFLCCVWFIHYSFICVC
jgi:hypothetical protein